LTIDGFYRWLDSVAATIIGLAGWFRSRRAVRLVETERGTFVVAGREHAADAAESRIDIAGGQVVGAVPESVATALRGSRAELVLHPDRFMFRPLELPKRAGEFLDGIVRSQIDRLTPWTANEAVFGWANPEDIGADRILITVAATARA